jgi:SAM-dependent methyltransferase
LYVDIVELRAFYASPLGQLVRRLAVQRLKRLWTDVDAKALVGVGFAVPYLDIFRERSERCLAFMPARQGVAAWPHKAGSAVALVDETDLPLNDSSIDRLLLVHCLEMTENSEALLNEAWRVLTPGGRLAVIVPNRRGIWARLDSTPFGHGRPYSRRQLSRLLRAANFTPQAWADALWVPPFRSRVMLRSAAAFERAGALIPAMPPGLILVDASKEVRRVIPADAQKARRFKILPVPEPAPTPARREQTG